MKAKAEAVKQGLWDADGKSVIKALLAPHHNDTRLMHPKVIPLEESVEMLNLSMKPPSLLPLRLLAVLEESR